MYQVTPADIVNVLVVMKLAPARETMILEAVLELKNTCGGMMQAFHTLFVEEWFTGTVS